MIKEYNKVRIKATGVLGEVIDVRETTKGKVYYIVESEKKGVPGGYGGSDSWKLFDCTEDELEVINGR